MLVRERALLLAHEPQCADQLLFEQDRNRDARAIGQLTPAACVGVLGILDDVCDVDRLTRQGGAAGQAGAVDLVRVLAVVLEVLLGAAIGDGVQEAVPQEVEPAVLDAGQRNRRLDDLVENRLEALRARDQAHDVADGSLPAQLPLDCLQQARVPDRDRRLVGEGLDELHVVVREREANVADDADRADQVAVEDDRDSQSCPGPGRQRERVVRVGQQIRDVHDVFEQRDASGNRASVALKGFVTPELPLLERPLSDR